MIPLIYIFFIVAFLIAQKKQDNSIVDIFWGLSPILAILLLCVFESPINYQFWILSSLVIIWGLRLSIYIFIRNYGKVEDFRYQEFRKNWGDKFLLKSFFYVFMFQASISLILSAPIMISAISPLTAVGLLTYLGLFVWIFGFVFEAFGDAQLAAFKKDPDNKGKIIQTGLWKYSRHPNYFGEAAQWWGIFLIALEVQFGLIAIISPLCITYFLLYISGVPLLEEKYASHPDWEEYAAKTPKFFPWSLFLKR